jgi:hypothetical protein
MSQERPDRRIDEPVDALYRACKRYEELHSRTDATGLDHAWSTIVMYYCQRVRDGDYLPPPDKEMTMEGHFAMTSDDLVLAWIGRLMNEIERRRNLRGRGASSGTAIV